MSRTFFFDIIWVMEISWFGHASFRLKGKETSVVTDPFKPGAVGLKFPSVEADIVTISHGHEDHNYIAGVSGQPFVIEAPGEYEIKGVSVFGVACFHDAQQGKTRGPNIAYSIEIDGLRVCHLGDLGHKLTNSQIEELNGIDILLIPIGGTYTLGPKQAVEVITQLEPKIVIPMHYRIDGLDPRLSNQLSGVDAFLKEMGEEKTAQPKLSITKDKLPEERELFILERKNA